jgi:hypothetical protein
MVAAVKEAEGLGALLARGAMVVFHPDDAPHWHGAGRGHFQLDAEDAGIFEVSNTKTALHFGLSQPGLVTALICRCAP